MNAFDTIKETFRQVINEVTDLTIGYRNIKKDYTLINNVNTQMCSKCGGKCCKRCGCHFSPDDFAEISFDFLKKELEKGYISIDFVEPQSIFQKEGCYILRIRNRGSDVVEKNYYRTPCILLTETGCKLNYENRPTGGKLLVPGKKECNSKYTIKDCCYEWSPYQDLLKELVEYFWDKNIECSL